MAVLVAVGLLLSACGSEPQTVHIKGELNFPAATTLPEHANAQISLVQLAEQSPQDATAKAVSGADEASTAVVSKRIVAAQTLHDFASTPVTFDLEFSDALLSPEGRYALTASIKSQDGQTLWRTLVPQVVKTQTTVTGIQLPLQPTVWNNDALAFVHWQCADGYRFKTAMVDGRIALRLGKQGVALSAVATQLGQRYAARDIWFEQHEGDAALHVDGKTHTACGAVVQ